MTRPDNVTPLPDRDELAADDQLLDHAGTSDPARDPLVAQLRDIVIGGNQ